MRSNKNILSKAFGQAGGPTAISKLVAKSPQAVRKWIEAGNLPRTEWTGETQYAKQIADHPGVTITALELAPNAGQYMPQPTATNESTAAGSPL